MKTSTFVGSALGLLLIFSVFSYAKTFIQAQDQKPALKQQPVLDVAGQIPEADEADAPAEAPSTATAEKPAEPNFAAPPATYFATAYSLRGRTASGLYVSRGLIAADPRHLPLGTRVRVEAGPWSGEYLVADTGGAIKGRIIDIWTPSAREAVQFGRRTVKLTVLSFPQRRAKLNGGRPRVVATAAAAPATIEPASKQEK
jgi:3D (Asp-Asp-Asp) domain-containing protein